MDNLNILQGRPKSGKTHLVLQLICNYQNVLYDTTDTWHTGTAYFTKKSLLNVQDLEKVVNNYPTLVDLVVIDDPTGKPLSSEEKEFIGDIAVKTNTKIIIVENLKTYGNQ